jgi:hypothetical protein
LIIYGTAQEFQNIKNILKELDAVARQVLMDVLVAEVTLTDDFRFGVDYQILNKGGDVRIFGREFESRGGIISGTLPAAAASGLTQFPSGLSGVIGTGNAIRAFVNAFASDARFKVLSSPSVLATDNRPARIQVGTEEPVPTGTITQTVGTIAESTSIQYRNTGRIVTIIPQVNSQGLVNLQILAEVSQRGANVTVGPNDFPSFDVRQAETTAVVQDGETLVIGGIITDSKNRSRNGIPYLMDLPVIGRFFGRTVDELDRTELIMLITPHVIRNREESKKVTEDFKKSLSVVRNELERMAREREKLQQKPLEEKPALPGPSGDPAPAPNLPASPAPAPSSAPTGPGVSAVPLKKINLESTMPPNEVKSLPPAAGLPKVPAPSGSAPSIRVENLQSTEAPRTQPAPAYALSASRQPEIRTGATIPKAIKAPDEAKSAQQWTVQVASMARQKDAEALADALRNKGYDAYIIAADVDGKTWHRIRVGQSLSRADASKLQKTLQVAEKFESSYVLSR